MSDELVAAVKPPESPNATFEQGCKPEIIESFQSLSAVGVILGQTPITDYAAAVVAQQIESLRSIADELDRQYAINVRGRKIKFKDRVGYVAVREKVASRIVDFVESLREIRSAYPTTDTPRSESGGALSWNPDDDRGPEFLQTTQRGTAAAED